jgi:outer membrane immunogenic protein
MNSKQLLLASVLVLTGGCAVAADLPSRAEPPTYIPPPPVFTWTGVYVGGQVGYQWSHPSLERVVPGLGTVFSDSLNANGVIGGGHIGYNYQINQFVVGLEGDVDGSTLSGTAADGLFASNANHDVRIDGSIRGRLGYAWDRALIYATGGVALRPDRFSSGKTVFGQDAADVTQVGWTLGAGIEYGITNNWSIRGEYRYTDYGHFDLPLVNSEPLVPGAFFRFRTADNRVQAGFSYKFDFLAPPAPVVAKY